MTMPDAVLQKLGFRIDVRNDGEAGSVIWFGPDGKERGKDDRAGVRPATGVEIRLWHALLAVCPPEAEEYVPDEADNPDW